MMLPKSVIRGEGWESVLWRIGTSPISLGLLDLTAEVTLCLAEGLP